VPDHQLVDFLKEEGREGTREGKSMLLLERTNKNKFTTVI